MYLLHGKRGPTGAGRDPYRSVDLVGLWRQDKTCLETLQSRIVDEPIQKVVSGAGLVGDIGVLSVGRGVVAWPKDIQGAGL